MSKIRIERPELFFCLVSPVGTDLDTIGSSLASHLKLYGYNVVTIHITPILPTLTLEEKITYRSLFDRYDDLIKRANGLREDFGDSVMATLAFFLIQAKRAEITGSADKAADGTAFIIRQMKRPEEIALFREVYGKQVFQISAYADPDLRKNRLSVKMRDFDHSETRSESFEPKSLELLIRDEYEDTLSHGQRVRDVFPMADVFIDATSNETIKDTIERFVKILFGYNFHSPTRDEYGMYIAKSASLRSVDLSRQVGAAIFNNRGEIKVLGCNEVPSPSGGTYWEGDDGDYREFTIGHDTNEHFKYRLLGDILKHFGKIGIIDESIASMSARDFIEKYKNEKSINLEKSLLMMDIIEYGRIIHAEMNAITDAARNGIMIDGGSLFCTTFPCHLCAKHIISSGIKRVIYIEPYPKSYTKELYRDDIRLERSKNRLDNKVYFEPFIGIAPFRYRDMFEKSKRKRESGDIKEWQYEKPLPIIEISSTDYVGSETSYLQALIQQFANKGIMLK